MNENPQEIRAAKKCKYCQSEIDAAAKVCPMCRRKLGGKKSGCLVGVLVVIVFVVFAVVIGVNLGDSTDPTDISDGSASVSSTKKQNPVQLKITDSYITENVIGENEIHLSLNNDSIETVNAFDFKIKAYNTYGEEITNWASDSFTGTELNIKPNSEWSSGNKIWTLHFVDNAVSFKVAITRYHLKDSNTTVDIKNADMIWHEVTK